MTLSTSGMYGIGVSSGLSTAKYVQFKQSSATGGGGYYSDDGTTATPTGRDLTFYIGATPVPEPASWALVPVLGTLAFLGFRRFKSQAAI